MDEKFILFLKQYAIKITLMPQYILIIILIVLNAAISLFRPKLQGQIVDQLSVPKTTTFSHLLTTLVIFLSILLMSYIITYLQRYIASLTSEEIAADIRQSIHHKLCKVNPTFFKKIKLGDILLKVDKDVSAIKQCGIISIITLLSNIAILIIITPYMFSIHMGIALSSLSLILCIPFISKMLGKKIKKCSEEVLQGYSEITNVINDSYNNWFAIRVFRCYEYMNLRYSRKNQKYKKNTNHQNFLYFLNTVITLTIQFIGTVIIWVVGAKEIFEGRMTIGTIMALMNYQSIIMNPIISIASFANDYHTSVVALKDIYSVLDYPNLAKKKLILQDKVKSIELKRICFKYSDTENYILHNIDAYFECGNIYAVLGKSGQGKSTLFKLLAGILEPHSGEVLINGTGFNKYDLESYWSKLGYVMQRSIFFEDTVIQNLNVVNKATFEDIENICKDLDIHGDITASQEQWETILKTEPPNFSEGQLRRMDIARNILKFPEILIFDEAVSNIDVKRRQQFYELLHRLSKDRIIIISTHNQEELVHADVIYRLSNEGMKLVGNKVQV